MTKELLTVIWRSFFSVTVLFILTRINGKKQISQITFFDYVIGISIGSIASEMSINKDVKLASGLVSLVIWSIFPLSLAYLAMANEKIKAFLDGSPIVVVQNGKLLEKNIRKSKFMVSEILEQLRIKGVFHIDDIDYAVVETNGDISFLLKPHKEIVTNSDLNLKPEYRGLSVNLIIDGKLQHKHLKNANINEQWIINELKKRNIKSIDDVFLATVDKAGNLYISSHNKNIKEYVVF
ncbi:DUF421 domain-containing protein [Clostridium sp. 'deep sea']|uniref:DUF421 domain-containing protein n=1 Tax=Clostridium sp. 'deep sea' TaxID=2779445 RepID=UPI0018969D65|nr:DUF421 domain-containing protein [Clostridium sp. 'deep sea']QOR33640.1 DUF421 domain-containing protein [Clostridium sp. 'deep sea']